MIGIIGIGIKINSDLNDLAETFKSEHTLNEPNLNILSESISPDKKYKYYEYQFDKGGLGYSRVFWSVIKSSPPFHPSPQSSVIFIIYASGSSTQ